MSRDVARDEAMEALESACECEHAALVEQIRLTEQARSCAAALEAETAALRALMHAFHIGGEPILNDVAAWVAIDRALVGYALTGRLGDEGRALAAALLEAEQ